MSRFGRHLHAEDLLHELGVTRPEHIDLEAIAHVCGAKIVYRKLNGCEARLIGTDDKAIISVSGTSSRGRQRFSAAHELGHWNRDTEPAGLHCAPDEIGTVVDAVPDQERAANAYAAGLLLPSFLVSPRLPRTGVLSRDLIEGLATEFRTSLTATAIRACRLGTLRTMVASYTTKGRTIFASSPSWPDGLFLAREIHYDTDVFELIYDGSVRHAVDQRNERSVCELLDGDSRSIASVHVEGFRVTDDAAVVVATVPDPV